MRETPSQLAVRHYFVDEAGDPALFNRKKQLIVGNEGCSNYFIVGKLDVEKPGTLAGELDSLRHKLLADPYFAGVPSMQLEQKKTALGFHAKDDLPEVRREVFRLLASEDVRFFAVLRDKSVIAQKVLDHNQTKPTYRYHPNQLYDRCVSQLLRDRLHKHDGYKIHFARRGSSDRTEALRNAIEAARGNFSRKWGVTGTAPIEIVASDVREVVCLQAADYFLWALQRFYERREDRFLNLLSDKLAFIYDVDDTRASGAGAFYSRSNPLTLSKSAKK